MIALVIVACLAGDPEEPGGCRGFVHSEQWAVPTGCVVASMTVAANFEQRNGGWHFKEAICVPVRRLDELLRRINGENV